MTIASKTVLVTGPPAASGRRWSPKPSAEAPGGCTPARASPWPTPIRGPLTLDVTNPAQIQAAAEQVDALDVLVNSAGVFLYDDLSDRAVLERHLAVNLFGTYEEIFPDPMSQVMAGSWRSGAAKALERQNAALAQAEPAAAQATGWD